MNAHQHTDMSISLDFDESSEIVERAGLVLDGAAQALSGSQFERVVLASGQRLILKHLPRDGDWLTRATAGAGRTRLLWDSGALAEVAATLDHAIVAVIQSNGAEVVVMRDVAEFLFPPRGMVSSTGLRRLLRGLAALHRAWEGRHSEGLCRPEARYQLFAPRLHAADLGPHSHPARDAILAGWEAFADLVPGEVAAAVFRVHEHAGPLAQALLASAPGTLLHGDAKLENLGLDRDRLVAIDWGELTGIGPA